VHDRTNNPPALDWQESGPIVSRYSAGGYYAKVQHVRDGTLPRGWCIWRGGGGPICARGPESGSAGKRAAEAAWARILSEAPHA